MAKMKKRFAESLEKIPCCEHDKRHNKEPDEMERAWKLLIECVRSNNIPTPLALGAFMELAAVAACEIGQPYEKFCKMIDDAKISWQSYWQ